MKRPTTKTVLICLSLFLFFLVIRFPFSSVKGYVFSQIYKNSGINIAFAEHVYLNFWGWPGISMTNVEILIPEHMLGSDVTINAKKITARVGVGSLFPPSLSYSLAADGIKSGGNVFVKLSRIKAGPNGLQKGSLVFEASDVDLGLIPLGGTSLEGKVTGDASLDLDFSDLSRSLGYASLQLKKFTTPGAAPQGFVIPSIKFGDAKAKLNIKNSNLEFSEFAFGGPGSDLQGQFGGEIRLGQTFMQSYLNMTIRLQISDSFSQSQDAASLVTILNNFDKRSPGKAYSLRWNKSIAGIAQNFLDNPPDALP